MNSKLRIIDIELITFMAYKVDNFFHQNIAASEAQIAFAPDISQYLLLRCIPSQETKVVKNYL